MPIRYRRLVIALGAYAVCVSVSGCIASAEDDADAEDTAATDEAVTGNLIHMGGFETTAWKNNTGIKGWDWYKSNFFDGCSATRHTGGHASGHALRVTEANPGIIDVYQKVGPESGATLHPSDPYKLKFSTKWISGEWGTQLLVVSFLDKDGEMIGGEHQVFPQFNAKDAPTSEWETHKVLLDLPAGTKELDVRIKSSSAPELNAEKRDWDGFSLVRVTSSS